jgi:peptidoglycan L-alanyl-D-glutamate endopeptidase CwlK
MKTKRMTWDKVTDNRILKLHPAIRELATNFINSVKDGLDIKLRVTQSLRTYAEQDDLYAQGRTKPGRIVTNAKGGFSWHNFGLALDVVEILDGQANWQTDWEEIARVGIGLGFSWGGNFKSFKDKPHFEIRYGLSLDQARARYKEGEYIKLIS